MIIKQNCKINVGLKILDKREDGYHNLISVFVPVSLYDTLRYKLTANKIIVITNKIPQEKNIVYKVAKLMQERYNVKRGIKINIKKRIPLEAGLGGGSADAAITIKTLNKMWNLALSEEESYRLGEEIGSDVPFFIKNKLAVVEGRGEKIKELKSGLRLSIIMIKPKIGFQTKEVFEHLNKESLSENNINEVIAGFKGNDLKRVVLNIKNDLEKGIEYNSLKVEAINKIKQDLTNVGALKSSMSGSGSCVYGIFDSSVKLNKVRVQLIKQGYKRKQIFVVTSL